MINHIKIEPDSPIPKYRQIINSFHDAIDGKFLKKDQKIPSINELTQKFQFSRDTVLTALNDLQARGIISSRPGKGYYVNKATITQTHKIFLLFDKLTFYKEELVVANGITTISTDFNAMGRSVVNLILNNKKDHIENPCSLIVRNSL